MAYQQLPSYYGYLSESVYDFLEELDSYFVVSAIAAARWRIILGTQLKGPAKYLYKEATAVDGAITLQVLAARPVTDATTNPVTYGAVPDDEQYEIHKQWVIGTFHDDNAKRRIKEQLMNIRQGSHEQPRDFYNRIVHLVQIAGLTNENSHYMVELAFMSGLHRPIADPDYIDQLQIKFAPSDYET